MNEAEIKLEPIKYERNHGDLTNIFKSIDDNFRMLINSDFIKGVKGDSVSLEDLVLVKDDKTLSDAGKSLFNDIYKNQSADEDKFAEALLKLSGKNTASIPVYVMNTYTGQADSAIKSIKHTTPKVYRDYRLNQDFDNSLKTNDFIDCSCIYSGDFDGTSWKWTIDTSCLPTIGKNSNGEFIWFINGKPTGITCQGLKGEDGNGSPMYVFRTMQEPDANDKLYLNDIWDILEHNWKSLSNYDSELEQNIFAFVHCIDNNLLKDVYFGPLDKDDQNKYYISVKDTKGISSVVNNLSFARILDDINPGNNLEYDDNKLPGLYVPFADGSETNGSLNRHFFMAADQKDLKISPSDFKPGSERHKLQIDYNLYVNGDKAVLPENTYIGTTTEDQLITKIMKKMLDYTCPVGTIIAEEFSSSGRPIIINGEKKDRSALNHALNKDDIIFLLCDGDNYNIKYTDNSKKNFTTKNLIGKFLRGRGVEANPSVDGGNDYITISNNNLPQHSHNTIDDNTSLFMQYKNKSYNGRISKAAIIAGARYMVNMDGSGVDLVDEMDGVNLVDAQFAHNDSNPWYTTFKNPGQQYISDQNNVFLGQEINLVETNTSSSGKEKPDPINILPSYYEICYFIRVN